jgi:argininosuccinate lyase
VSTGDDYLGSGGRLTGAPAPELVAAGFAAEIGHAPRLARALSLADMAHAVALIEGGALGGLDAAALAGGLLDLDAMDPGDFPWDPVLGDAFNSREHELRRRVGAAAAGWLSAGRPRREAFRVARRLVAREGARRLHDAVTDLADALAAQAERHGGDLAADYTYLQPAQPSTIGHLVLFHAMPALRDAERLRRAVAWLDLSVAGAGGSAGSRWPLDRARLAELLGCTGVMPHTKDATWAADGYVELVADLAIAATHQAQLAQDLEILASREFGQVRLAEGHTRASALMPQKRNPYALAVIRAQAGTAAGDLAALLTGLHTGSARTDHYHLLNGVVPRALDEAARSARLAAEVAAGLELDPARAAQAARDGFTSAADVADVVAQRGGLDYRSAHTVVGRAVRELAEAGRAPDELSADLIARAAEEVLGRPVEVPEEALAAALDPAACIGDRPQIGSCEPAQVEAMVVDARRRTDEGRRWSAACAERWAEAERGLRAAATRLAGRR